MNKKIAVFPGSFDPFTKGHEDVVLKGLGLVDELIIAVGHNSTKKGYYSIESRLEHIASLFVAHPQVRILTFNGLTVDFAQKEGARFLLRGLRDGKDFEYERSIAQMNHSLNPKIETLFLITKQEVNHINATIVREVHKNGGIIDAFVTNSHILVPSL